jgi:hypothetical protein
MGLFSTTAEHEGLISVPWSQVFPLSLPDVFASLRLTVSMALKKSPKMADKIPHFSGLKSPHGREKMAILWP